MYIIAFFRSSLFLSHLLLSLSRSLARSLLFCLSISLFCPVDSRCVSAGLCHFVSLYVTHARTLVLFLSTLFCLSFSLAFSLLLSRSLFLFFLWSRN